MILVVFIASMRPSQFRRKNRKCNEKGGWRESNNITHVGPAHEKLAALRERARVRARARF